jgi:hypothetical protein
MLGQIHALRYRYKTRLQLRPVRMDGPRPWRNPPLRRIKHLQAFRGRTPSTKALAGRYNRILRLPVLLFTILALTSCRQAPKAEAVRQAVVDRLTQMGMPVTNMDIAVTSFEPNGNEADATVSLTLKDAQGAPPMVMKYHMQQQGGKWVVVSRRDEGASPHGGGVAPGAASPRGGSGAMPSPEDLPPAGKKK